MSKNLVVQKMNYISSKSSPISKDYVLGRSLGEGAFAAVRVGVHKLTKQERAIKILRKSGTDEEKLRAEVEILSKLSHPNIMQIYEVYNDDTNYYIVSEFCRGGELFEEIEGRGTFSEKDAAKIMRQIMSAVCYSHQNGFVHRDLKPENILLEEKDDKELVIKIIDWGCALPIKKNQKLHKADGTPYYIAPEVLEGNYDEKCDVWSAGVILYIMLCGYPPFNGENDEEILLNVKQGEFDFPSEEWDTVSDEAKELINKMLRYNPNERISAYESLQHMWFKKYADGDGADIDKKVEINVLKNMRNFKRNRRLEQVTVGFITNQLLSRDERKKMRQIFAKWDTNGDGILSREEIIEGYRKAYGKVDENEVDNMIKSVDLDGNGCVDYNEFVACATNKEKVLNEENLEFAFSQIDADNSGKISIDEIRRLFCKGDNIGVDKKVFENIMKEADINGDGEIEFEEFKKLMIKFFT